MVYDVALDIKGMQFNDTIIQLNQTIETGGVQVMVQQRDFDLLTSASLLFFLQTRLKTKLTFSEW